MALPNVTAFTALTAVGPTAFVANSAASFVFQVVVATIGTSVVVRLQGSNDGTNFFNLQASDNTITANGVYGYAIANTPCLYVRANLITIVTGSPTVTITLAQDTAP
jgi:hypothetical protein